MSKVIVIGGGAAGMMAAIFAARNNHEVVVYEKNEKLGKKLYITGKGRCNITNACDMEALFEHVITNKKFLYSAFYSFTNQDTMNFFEEIGLPIKVERGDRVFPVSDKSSDVINVMARELNRLGVMIEFQKEVEKVVVKDGNFQGIMLKGNKKMISGDKIIIATGGLSYKTTGSTGAGYEFAKKMGHKVTELSPSLVPFNIKEQYIRDLQGLSLKNIKVCIKVGSKTLYEDFGEMLFTHFGVSGPLILSGSSYIQDKFKNKDLNLVVDLKPALTEEQLDARILRDFDAALNKQFKNSLDQLLPKKTIPIIIQLSGISEDKKVNTITKAERLNLVKVIKNFTMSIASLRDYNEAVITRGGVMVKEIDPSTMESKLVQNVYYVGEVLDLDALTGGFNLQIAWSTAYVAGNAV